MKITLKNIELTIKEKLNWEEVLNFEELLTSKDSYYTENWIEYTKPSHYLVLTNFIIDNFVISLDLISEIPQTFSDSFSIKKIINDIDYTKMEDLIKITDEFSSFLTKKKS